MRILSTLWGISLESHFSLEKGLAHLDEGNELSMGGGGGKGSYQLININVSRVVLLTERIQSLGI